LRQIRRRLFHWENGQLEIGGCTSKNQANLQQDDTGLQGVPELLIHLRFCSVSHFNEINVKIYRDQFSKTAASFRHVKKRGPVTNTLPVVTGGDRNWEEIASANE
jgi:hypothetical protein